MLTAILVLAAFLAAFILTYFLVGFQARRVEKQFRQQASSLEERRAKDEALLSSIGEGIVVTDRNGLVELINQRAEELVGWKLEEVVSKHWYEVAVLEDEKGNLIPPEERATQRVLETGKVMANDTYYYVRKDGTRFPVGTTAAPVIYKGKTIGVIAVFRDITHDKEIDRAKSEFVSLASHQLRTPLSAIKWFAEMLLNGDAGQLAKEQAEYLRNIYQSNERMIELVNSLLNISRIESGRIIVDPVPTDLAELVQQVLLDLKAKITEKKFRLVVSTHSQLPKLMVDPRLVRQVYLILLSNAMKYTPESGEILVFISKNDREVISQISDSGFGIPEPEQKRVFERFFRATNAVKTVTDGTGLGLYLAKTIVESSGGRIWFVSAEGKGTTFWFSIPLEGMKPKKGDVTLNT
jgi:PAS domain S-box-containing protein